MDFSFYKKTDVKKWTPGYEIPKSEKAGDASE